MVEPLTLTTVSTVILTEGIKFLYGQATEALKAWRGRQQRRQEHDRTNASAGVHERA